MYIDINQLINDIKILENNIVKSKSIIDDFNIYYNFDCLLSAYYVLSNKKYQLRKEISKKMNLYNELKNKLFTKVDLKDRKIYIEQSTNVINSFNKKNNRKNNFKVNLSNQEIIELMEDFLSNYDEKLVLKLRELIENKKIYLYKKAPSKLMPTYYGVSTLDKGYIICPDNHNIETASSLMHEFGHHLDINNLSNLEAKKGMWKEVSSIYMERLFINYLASLYSEANILKEQLNKDIYNYFETVLYSLNNNINDYYLRQFLIYGYSSLVALEYSSFYEQDPELTKLNIESFISSQPKHNGGLEMMSLYGLEKENIVKCKTLRKQLNDRVFK